MKKIILFSFFILFSGLVGAQSTYQTYIYNTAWNHLPEKIRNELVRNDTAIYNKAGRNLKIYLRRYLPGRKILGVEIFPKQMYRVFQGEILQMIERESAYFLFLPSDEWEAYARAEKIGFFKPESQRIYKRDIADMAGDVRNINLTQFDNRYQVSLENSKRQKLIFSFPMSYTFITGVDRFKLQADLITNIQAHKYSGIPFNQDTAGLEKRGDFWVYEGKHFLIPQLKYIVFYDKHKKLVYNPEIYPRESLANLLTTDISEQYDHNLKVYYYSYDGKHDFEISLKKLLGYFSGDFEKYFGIEDFHDNKVRGTLILRHPALGYIHMLDIHFTSGKDGQADLTAYFYAYIPQNEIKEFFGTDGKPENQ